MLTFAKGSIGPKREYLSLVSLLDLLYRLMKQMAKGNLTNARCLFKHIAVLRAQVREMEREREKMESCHGASLTFIMHFPS